MSDYSEIFTLAKVFKQGISRANMMLSSRVRTIIDVEISDTEILLACDNCKIRVPRGRASVETIELARLVANDDVPSAADVTLNIILATGVVRLRMPNICEYADGSVIAGVNICNLNGALASRGFDRVGDVYTIRANHVVAPVDLPDDIETVEIFDDM